LEFTPSIGHDGRSTAPPGPGDLPRSGKCLRSGDCSRPVIRYAGPVAFQVGDGRPHRSQRPIGRQFSDPQTEFGRHLRPPGRLVPVGLGVQPRPPVRGCASRRASRVTVLRAIGETTAASAAGAGVPTFSLAGDPSPPGNTMAAGDLVAIRETDGVTRLYTVSSFVGLAVTLTTNLVAGVSSGSWVYNFGVLTDIDPYTGEPHEVYDLEANVVTDWVSNVGIIGSHLPDQPLLVSIDNVIDPGYILRMVHAYANPGQPLVSTTDPGLSFPIM
jgi:hypothetical protein